MSSLLFPAVQLYQSLLKGHMEPNVDTVPLSKLFEVEKGDVFDVTWWDKVDSTPYGYTINAKDPGKSKSSGQIVRAGANPASTSILVS